MCNHFGRAVFRRVGFVWYLSAAKATFYATEASTRLYWESDSHLLAVFLPSPVLMGVYIGEKQIETDYTF